MSATYNIFYDSNKEIIWSSTAAVNSDIISAEAAKGYTHVALDSTNIPVSEQYYINSDATAIVTKTVFNPTFSSATASVDDVINVTGVPAGNRLPIVPALLIICIPNPAMLPYIPDKAVCVF